MELFQLKTGGWIVIIRHIITSIKKKTISADQFVSAPDNLTRAHSRTEEQCQFFEIRAHSREIYLEYHSVCLLVRIGTPTALPLPQACSSPRNRERHTRPPVRGWGVPIPTTMEKKLGTLSTLWIGWSRSILDTGQNCFARVVTYVDSLLEHIQCIQMN